MLNAVKLFSGLLSCAFYSCEKFLFCKFSGISLFFGNEFPQILGSSSQKIFIFSYNTHIAEHFRIQLHCCHFIVFFISAAKIQKFSLKQPR